MEWGPIQLKRMQEADIERIRRHRNSPHTRKYMEYQKYISAQAQQAWFERVNNPYHFYFLFGARSRQKKQGLIHLSSIHYEKKRRMGRYFSL